MKLSELIASLNGTICNSSLKAACEGPDVSAEGSPDALRSVTHPPQASSDDPEITSIHCRAQEVCPGGLFVAIKGQSADGHDFIDQALAHGAVAVVAQQPLECRVPVIRVSDSRLAMSALADRFFGEPSKHLYIMGITGTNGKTTTALIIESILTAAGIPTGVIGTIDYRYAGKTYNNPMTTPESIDLQRILRDMRQAGVSHVVMEVSSHAIDQRRIAHCRMDVGLFTNLTQDHLDFHGTMDAYWACKKRLFTEHLSSGPKSDRAVAVINGDTNRGRELIAECIDTDGGGMRVINTGTNPDSTIRADQVTFDITGITGVVTLPAGRFQLNSRLIGKHNLENILLAAGAGAAAGLDAKCIADGINTATAVPGRLERVDNPAGRHVYVDYAHTPDALENVLLSIRAVTGNRLICIFGCGGDRDQSKRPLMGKIAGRLSDLAVVTSDNPRTESPRAIIEQILAGTRKTSPHQYTRRDLKTGFQNRGFVIEPDRRQAIRLGIRASQPDDIILIAGKGHETYQIIGNRTVDFDDRVEAKAALSANRGGI